MKHFYLFFILLFFLSSFVSGQSPDSTKKVFNVSGDFNITNNGISIVPAFSLGKPAVIINLALGGKKLSFEPSWFFSAKDAKPWAFLMWGRYKMIDNDKLKLRLGTHIGFPISDIRAVSGSASYDVQQIQRFLAIEVAPTYIFNKHFSLNFYILRARALQKESLQNNRFIAFTPSLGVGLGKEVTLRYSPQFYHLKLDNDKGVYVFHTVAFAKKDTPFMLSFNMNQFIDTEITAGKNYDWNITLTYLLNKQFVKK